MTLLLKLAFRNIFRNFRRSLLTFLAISIGTALSILFIGFSIGAERQSIKLSVDTNNGHVKIYGRGYVDEDLTLTLDHTIDNYSETIGRLRNVSDIVSFSERIIFPSSITDSIDELNLSGCGIDTEREDAVFNLSKKVISGEYLHPGEERMLLTSKIANLFSVEAGDVLTIIARTKYGAINAIDLEIAGIVDIGNMEVDNQYYFIPLDVAQELLEMQDMVTEIVLMVSSMESAENLKLNAETALGNDKYDIVTWEYLCRDLIRLYEIRKKARIIMIFILFMMAAASVMNTMLMSVFERTREIGTIMAMGLRKSGIILLFILESMFLGILGSLVGSILGGGATYYYKFHGIDISSYMELSNSNLPFGKYIYTEITPEYILGAFLLGVTIAVLSAAYPALKGANLAPANALRYV